MAPSLRRIRLRQEKGSVDRPGTCDYLGTQSSEAWFSGHVTALKMSERVGKDPGTVIGRVHSQYNKEDRSRQG